MSFTGVTRSSEDNEGEQQIQARTEEAQRRKHVRQWKCRIYGKYVIIYNTVWPVKFTGKNVSIFKPISCKIDFNLLNFSACMIHAYFTY